MLAPHTTALSSAILQALIPQCVGMSAGRIVSLMHQQPHVIVSPTKDIGATLTEIDNHGNQVFGELGTRVVSCMIFVLDLISLIPRLSPAPFS